MATREERWIEVGRRVDGSPWRIRVVEHRENSQAGRCVVFGGMLGDKPLGSLAVQALDRELAGRRDLDGQVVLVPAANPRRWSTRPERTLTFGYSLARSPVTGVVSSLTNSRRR